MRGQTPGLASYVQAPYEVRGWRSARRPGYFGFAGITVDGATGAGAGAPVAGPPPDGMTVAGATGGGAGLSLEAFFGLGQHGGSLMQSPQQAESVTAARTEPTSETRVRTGGAPFAAVRC
jgi:hypothetical protein